QRFVELFHEHEFWESHEVLEGPWREGGSGFYHGLILLASAFVHVQRDNTHGIAAQLRKAEAALEPFVPHYLGLDVAEILTEARALRSRAERERTSPPDRAPWQTRVRFPTLTLDPARLRGDEPELDGE
ncbi:MAG: DUF309 domain-containing protein, partial [Gemmatimonadota bacterium]